MNGQNLTLPNTSLKDEIKKSRDDKKKEKLKFIISLILSNLVVLTLCLNFSSHPPNQQFKTLEKKLHSHHQMMIIPLESMLVEEKIGAAEIPITLLSRNHKKIAEKAFLHQLVKKEDNVQHFKIEIHNQDLSDVTASINEGVIAIPYVEEIKREIKKPRGSKYEVSL